MMVIETNLHVALPLLKEQRVPATIFVTYDAIEIGQFGWGCVFFDRTILTTTANQLDLHTWGVGDYSLSTRAARETAVISLHRLLKRLPHAEKQRIIASVISTFGSEISGERIMMTWDEVRAFAQGIW